MKSQYRYCEIFLFCNKYPKNIWIPALIKSDFYTNVIVKGLNIQLKTINKAVYGYIILNVSESVF